MLQSGLKAFRKTQDAGVRMSLAWSFIKGVDFRNYDSTDNRALSMSESHW